MWFSSGAHLTRNALRAIVASAFSIFVLASVLTIGPIYVGATPGCGVAEAATAASYVTVDQSGSSFRYLVNGSPQVLIGMGYNPIYRYLSTDDRAARYDQDFRILCGAGVNHIFGWDFDKGYEQDHFDELTLDYANKYGIGVVMPFYIPASADFNDPNVTAGLMSQAAIKIERFKNHPALRMWGVGNEVLLDMPQGGDREAFARFYLDLADMFHSLDPNHPVIYREAEDNLVSGANNLLSRPGEPRPWLLFGSNVYSYNNLERILDDWRSESPAPLVISEFGSEGALDNNERMLGYLAMWRSLRAHSDFVLGGAPYCWTTAGPEPTDVKWGLMDAQSKPVDNTFSQLSQDWSRENGGPRACPALPTPTPTATATPSPSATPSPTATLTVNPTVTVTPAATATAGTHRTIQLAAGWNLISVPGPLQSPSVTALFAGNPEVTRVNGFDNGAWTVARRDSSGWSGNLTEILDGKGYWVYASSSTVLSFVAGDRVPGSPGYLSTGWNLIGFSSSQTSLPVESYLQPLQSKWVSIYSYDPVKGWQVAKAGGIGFSQMEMGRGYWMSLSAAGTLWQ